MALSKIICARAVVGFSKVKSGPALNHQRCFTIAEGARVGGEHDRGHPPLVRWIRWIDGPPSTDVQGGSTSVETILMHFGTISALEALLILYVSLWVSLDQLASLHSVPLRYLVPLSLGVEYNETPTGISRLE